MAGDSARPHRDPEAVALGSGRVTVAEEGDSPPEGSPQRRGASVADAMSWGSQTRSFVFSEPWGRLTVALWGADVPPPLPVSSRLCVCFVNSAGEILTRRAASLWTFSPQSGGHFHPRNLIFPRCWACSGRWAPAGTGRAAGSCSKQSWGPTQASLRARLRVGGREKSSADCFGDSLAQRSQHCLDLRKPTRN